MNNSRHANGCQRKNRTYTRFESRYSSHSKSLFLALSGSGMRHSREVPFGPAVEGAYLKSIVQPLLRLRMETGWALAMVSVRVTLSS